MRDRGPRPPLKPKPRGLRVPATLLVMAALATYLLLALPMVLRAPFHADDFIFLERTRSAPFAWLWQTADVPFGYYRPWSREFSFWLLQRLFGARELPFHLTALGLFLGTLAMFHALARRLAGPLAAVAATFGVAAMAAWGTLLIWPSGLQDLWMYAFGMAAILCVSRGRIVLAAVGTALALLSKESALVLPAIAAAYVVVIERRNPFQALWRTAPLWGVTAGWTFLHPLVAGRLYHHAAAAPADATAWINPLAGSLLLQAAASMVNLDAPLHPTLRWLAVAQDALRPMAVLVIPALIVALRSGRRPAAARRTEVPPGRLIAFGVAWAILGWLPLLQPPLTWHAYYGLFGALGAWLALGCLLSRARWALAPVLGAMVVLAAAQALTPSLDLGTAFYQIRASNFVLMTRTFLLAQDPVPPPHSRIFLAQVPGAVGLIPWDQRSIAPQIWTGDTTLSMYYVSRYQPRTPGDSLGKDVLFSYDNGRGWQSQLIDVPTAASPPEIVQQYATFLWSIGRPADARTQFLRLAQQYPAEWAAAFNLGSCYLQMGDSAQALRWYERAASLPGAPDKLKLTAERVRRARAR